MIYVKPDLNASQDIPLVHSPVPAFDSHSSQVTSSVPAFDSHSSQVNSPIPAFDSHSLQVHSPVPTFGNHSSQVNSSVPAFDSHSSQVHSPVPAFDSHSSQVHSPVPAFTSHSSQVHSPVPASDSHSYSEITLNQWMVSCTSLAGLHQENNSCDENAELNFTTRHNHLGDKNERWKDLRLTPISWMSCSVLARLSSVSAIMASRRSL